MKIDHKHEISSYRAARGALEIVSVPPLHYLMIDGHGDPNTAPAYADALATLYPVSYALKFLSKRTLDRDYVVMPLEALWWAEDPAAFTTGRDKSAWSWTVMIMTPDWLGADHLETAIETVRGKGGAPALERLRFERFEEGLAVQTLHVGPYDDEGPVLATMHEDFIPDHGLRMTGRHHEIYLSDARRTAPERLKTILRQPVRRR